MDLERLNELVSSGTGSHFMLDLDEKVYRSSVGIAQSDLKLIKSKSLYHYRYAKTSKKDTPALILGRAIHKAIFEWDTFKDCYKVRPKDLNLRTKAGREEIAKMMEGGFEVLSREDMTMIKRMRMSIRRKPKIRDLIKGCQFEKSHFARHNERIILKCRTDGYDPKTNTIVDLKTTLDASPRTFIRDIFKYGYHIQDAFYIDVIEKITGETPSFKIVALEKSYPYEACQYELSPKSVAIGRKDYMEQLERLDHSLKTNIWPSYDDSVVVRPPAWLEKQAFDDVE